MEKIYILYVNHAPPHANTEDWQIHSVHKTNDGASGAALKRLASSTVASRDKTTTVDASHRIIEMILEP